MPLFSCNFRASSNVNGLIAQVWSVELFRVWSSVELSGIWAMVLMTRGSTGSNLRDYLTVFSAGTGSDLRTCLTGFSCGDEFKLTSLAK
jgi:hypothetical protein